MTPFVQALHVLATLLDAMPSTRAALERWPLEIADVPLRRVTKQLADRVRLGASLPEAASPLCAVVGADARLFVDVVVAHAGSGSAMSEIVSRIAEVITQRHRLEDLGRAASAASALSTRMIGTMALGFAVLFPAWRQVPPVTAGVSIAISLLLGWAGIAWARRLVPKVSATDDARAALADLVAGLVEGGMSFSQALGLATRDVDELRRVRRLVRLGMPWTRALQRSHDPGMRRLGIVIGVAQEMGVPLGPGLQLFASNARAERERRFDLRARRAPVLLVLPLTLCVLPSFALMVGVPLLHSMSS